MMAERVLSVDLGGTNIRAAVVGPDGGLLAHATRPTPARSGAAAVIAAIGEACDSALEVCPLSEDAPLGLCAPGPLDSEAGLTIGTPTIAGFENFPLRDALAARLRRPVLVDNDGHAAAIGEWQFGAARGERHFVFITVSTGIGGGAVIDGRLIRGRRGLAGHFGHLLVGNPRDVCFCGTSGCWEATASGTALQRRAREAGFADLRVAFRSLRDGAPHAHAFLDAAAHDLARGLVTVAHAFSPDVFVLGGGVMAEFDQLEPLIVRHFQALCLPAFRSISFRRAELGDSAGLVGMAHQARSLVAWDLGAALPNA